MTDEAKKLHEGIRSGAIDCLGPISCDRSMAQHHPRCPWQRAIERIYELGRKND